MTPTSRVPHVRHRLTWGYSLLLAALTLNLSAQTPDAPQLVDAKPFLDRLATFYQQDWHPDPTAPASPAPLRRGLPQPLDSPPFPSADWSYGGSPTIGEADGNSYPLMTAIKGAATNGAKSRTKLYGWFDLTVNGSTSAHRNSPESNDLYSNRFELNQAVLYLERLPDSVQRDHVDVGYL
jgi:hypothetical protein